MPKYTGTTNVVPEKTVNDNCNAFPSGFAKSIFYIDNYMLCKTFLTFKRKKNAYKFSSCGKNS